MGSFCISAPRLAATRPSSRGCELAMTALRWQSADALGLAGSRTGPEHTRDPHDDRRKNKWKYHLHLKRWVRFLRAKAGLAELFPRHLRGVGPRERRDPCGLPERRTPSNTESLRTPPHWPRFASLRDVSSRVFSKSPTERPGFHPCLYVGSQDHLGELWERRVKRKASALDSGGKRSDGATSFLPGVHLETARIAVGCHRYQGDAGGVGWGRADAGEHDRAYSAASRSRR